MRYLENDMIKWSRRFVVNLIFFSEKKEKLFLSFESTRAKLSSDASKLFLGFHFNFAVFLNFITFLNLLTTNVDDGDKR